MKPLAPLTVSHRAEFARQVWLIRVDPATTLEDLLNPGFWVHQTLLSRGDLLEIVAHDNSFDILLRVTEIFGKVPAVRVLRSFVSAEAETSGDVVEQVLSPDGVRWRAMASGQEIASGLASRAEAEAALAAHRSGASPSAQHG